MKRFFLYSFLMFSLIFCSSHSQPKLEIVGGDNFDWGKVKPKENFISTKVKLKNIGNSKLIFGDIKPSCGCTTAPIDKKELEPGDVATLDVTIKIQPGQVGGISKSITINSNDSTQTSKLLMLRADIVRDLVLTPGYTFVIPEMKVGSESGGNFKVKNNSDKPLDLTDFEVTPPTTSINTHGKVSLAPGQEIEVITKSKPTQKGSYNCKITFKTTNPDYPNIEITGYGTVSESPIFNN